MNKPPLKHLYVTWPEFHRSVEDLAQQLVSEKFDGILAVSRGGLVPAGIMSYRLDIPHVDTVCISSYHDQRRTRPVVLKAPQAGDARVLVIDELADSGETADTVRTLWPRAFIATVYTKPAARAHIDAFAVTVPQDTWVYFPWDKPL